MYANTNTLETAPKTVLETYVRQVEKLVHLTINGEEIVTTDNHPFYVQGRGFINAGNLLVGDKLISVNGEDLFVEKHRVEELDEPVDVYNFQVEDYHTYFVGESAVWVHNNNKACPVPEPRKSEKHKTADGEPLTYKSNSKHTPGQDGNCSDAGIEPRNSFELFEDSIASTEKTGHRYAYEKETDTIHRFFSNAEETEWHWCGSENQGKNSLNITKIPKDIKKTFNADDFEKEKALIKQEFEAQREVVMQKLTQDAFKEGFQVKSAQNGIYMMPIVEGKVIEEEEFEKLEESVKQHYEEKSTVVQQQIMEAIGQIKQIEREADKKVSEWQSNIALLTVNAHINFIKAKYKRNKKINKFLTDIKQDVLKNVSYFLEEDKQAQNNQPQQGPMAKKQDPCLNYRVNLFIDNSETQGAPVIMDSNYSFNNLFGKLEYENYYGSFKTDFTMLKPGLLQKANGGYIIFQAKDLLANGMCYEELKRVLRVKEVSIDNSIEQRSSMTLISLKPEPIPIDLKVILIGSSNIYHTLLSMDSDFRRLFKIKVEFEETAPITEENVNKLAQFVHSFCEQEELPQLDKSAMASIVEYASRIAGDNNKISTRFTELAQVVGEAGTWAKLAKAKVVTSDFVKKALEERVERIKKYDEKYIDICYGRFYDHSFILLGWRYFAQNKRGKF